MQDDLRDEQLINTTLADLESVAAGEPARITAKGLETMIDSVLPTHSVDEMVSDTDWIRDVLATEDE